MAQPVEEVDEPPPGAGGFDRDRGVRGQLAEELFQSRRIIAEAVLAQSPIVRKTAICESCLCKSTPTCTMLVASCLRVRCERFL